MLPFLVEQRIEKINCVTTVEGVYQFSYEVDQGGGGICNHPDSQIKACQEPGSPYIDNEVFLMTYRKCLDVSTSKNQRKSSTDTGHFLKGESIRCKPNCVCWCEFIFSESMQNLVFGNWNWYLTLLYFVPCWAFTQRCVTSVWGHGLLWRMG